MHGPCLRPMSITLTYVRNIFMYKYDMVAIGTCELERIFFKENDIVNRRHGV